MTKLIIVESPTKASKIQEFLGKGYIVAACKGHIADLAKGGKFGLGVDINNNFKPRYVLMEEKLSTLDNLINLGKQCDIIYLGSDPDIEGTAIAWHLQQRLQDLNKPIKRIVFNQISKPALLKALKNAGDIDMNIVHSQEGRRILDRIVGFTASPFLMNFFGNNLSSGRVQSVLTRIIIDREREIEKFVPQDFWTIQVPLIKDKVEFFTKYPNKINDLNTANALFSKLNNKNDEFIVSEVLAEEEKKSPPAPLITATLQRLMSKSGISPDKTMKAAQNLFECGFITYHRTDAPVTSEEGLKELKEYLVTNNLAFPKKFNVFKAKASAQEAHECIRPIDLNIIPESNFAIIDPDEKAVYKAIWQYFIASQMMPAIYSTLRVTAYLKSDKKIEVKASGKSLKSKGFLEILEINDTSKIDIPNLVVGDVLQLSNSAKLEKKQTQPLPRFSEDKLIKELEDRGIGRPSTYAELLNKVTTRNYVEKRGTVYHPTDLGKKITDVLAHSFSFMNYDYTANLESQLDEIASGKLTHTDMLKNFYAGYKKELDSAYLKQGGTLCHKCGNAMVVRTAKTGNKFLSCSLFPKCRTAKNL